MRRLLVYILFCATLFTSCKKEKAAPDPLPIVKLSENNEIISFRFNAKDNPKQLLKDVVCRIYDDHIVGIIPYLTTDKTLIPTFLSSGISIKLEDSIQVSGVTQNNFQQPLKYTITAENGTTKEYTVTLYSFTELPILYLESEAPILVKETWISGSMVIDPNSSSEQPVTETSMEIRGRGNTTWSLPKQPYRFKLPSKMPMLGMPADKKWSLLANFSDKTLMRNSIGFELGRMFEVPFTPRSKYVEVILNGTFLGNYLLTDQIEIGENRINITELNKNSTDITGGYLLEIDERLDADYWFRTAKNVPFTIKSPEVMTDDQVYYIRGYVQETERVLFSPSFNDSVDGYAKYIDVESFINWYLVNELLKNNDAIFYSSCFMHKNQNGKLSMGPIWDFDIAIGNVNYNGNNDPKGWWVRDASWYKRLFEDPAFEHKVVERWKEIKATKLNTIFDYINATSQQLRYSQKENNKKWDVLYNYTWPNAIVLGSYENEVQYMKEWLIKRINWMDNELLMQSK